MRYGAEHKQQTRQRVLTEAARAIREEGPHQLGVADVMAKAGLTHGGFYAHFKSKDELVAATIDQMFAQGRERIRLESEGHDPAGALRNYVNFYLSRSHRDSRDSGCPLPYLAADAPRLTQAARERFAEGFRGLRDTLAGKLALIGFDACEDAAASMLAEMVGALSLARAEPDIDKSDDILRRSRAALRARFNLEAQS